MSRGAATALRTADFVISLYVTRRNGFAPATGSRTSFRCQIQIEDNLNSCLAINLQWIMEFVQIASLWNNHRLIEGNPILNLVAKKLETFLGKNNK